MHFCLFAGCFGRCGIHRRANPDRLDVDELANTERGKFTAIAAALDAAERQTWIGGGHTVDEDAAGFNATGQGASALDVSCPQVAPQAKIRVVCQFYGMVSITCANNCRDWAKRLFVEDGHIWID